MGPTSVKGVKHSVVPGTIVVDNVYCVYKAARVMLVCIECGSKYPEVNGTMLDCDSNVDSLFLKAAKDTRMIDRRRRWDTIVSFAPGWEIWCAEFTGKYTVAVTLFKDEKSSVRTKTKAGRR